MIGNLLCKLSECTKKIYYNQINIKLSKYKKYKIIEKSERDSSHLIYTKSYIPINLEDDV